MNTLMTIRETLETDITHETDNLNYDVIQLEHRKKLSKVTEQIDITLDDINYHKYLVSFQESYLSEGFLPISPDIVTKLKYSAMIRETGLIERKSFNREKINYTVHDNEGYGLLYSGDIPDFSLNNIERFDSINPHAAIFTIHSNEPLPITKLKPKITSMREILFGVDPVVLGWLNHPSITFKGDRSILDSLKHSFRMYGKKYLDFHNAFIVAIWDNDKELEIVN